MVSGGVAHAAQPSRWLTHTIRLGYAIQFTKRPAKFNCVLETSVAVRNAPVLREEIAVLLAKDAIEPVPRAALSQPLLHRIQERRWSPTNPGSARLEPAFAQAPVQDADVQAHYKMQPAPGLACSDRLERMLTFMFRSFCDTGSRFKVQGSLLFVTYTIIQGIIGSEMLVGTGPLNGKCKKEK